MGLPWLVPSLSPVTKHFGEVAAAHLDVCLPGLPSLLREGVEHVSGLGKVRHVEDSVRAFLVNADLHDPEGKVLTSVG